MEQARALQGVHDIADVSQQQMQDGQDAISKMVFIGKDLNEKAIRDSFEACLVST